MNNSIIKKTVELVNGFKITAKGNRFSENLMFFDDLGLDLLFTWEVDDMWFEVNRDGSYEMLKMPF